MSARAGSLRGLLARFLAIAGLLAMHPAHAVNVTIEVKNVNGAPAAEAIVIFDPTTPAPVAAPRATIIDQVNKRFVPRVTVLRTGTKVSFPNADNIRHQVFSFSDAKKFTLKLYAGSPRADIVFDKPGLVVLGCNIHDTMVAFVGVVDTPYFVKTDDAGTAVLDLPPGEYHLRAWHPALHTSMPSRLITVAATQMSIPLRMDLSGSLDQVAAWPE